MSAPKRAVRPLDPAALLWLAPAWLAMAWLVTKASWFWSHNPDLQFGWIVVLLCAYVFYEAWEIRPDPRTAAKLLPLALALPGLGLLFLTQLYQAAYGLTPASMSGLAVGAILVVLANLHFVYGHPGVRHFAFAFCFILIALPLPSLIYSPIVTGLQSKVASVNVEVLNILGIPAVRSGSVIRLPNCSVGVDEACSGIRSLQSAVMATLFIGHLTLKRKRLRVLLLALGILIAIAGNLVRSLTLSLTANARGAEAIQTVHDAAGWSILTCTVIGVAVIAWGLNRLEKKAGALRQATPAATISHPPASAS